MDGNKNEIKLVIPFDQSLLLGISFGNGLKQHLDRQLELLIS